MTEPQPKPSIEYDSMPVDALRYLWNIQEKEAQMIAEQDANANPGAEIQSIHNSLRQILVEQGVDEELLSSGNIRHSTILYMIYWFHRLRNNKVEQSRIDSHLLEYIGNAVENPRALSKILTSNDELKIEATHYVEKLMVPIRTVDLVIMKSGNEENPDKEVLTLDRTYYPFGQALPGGFIKDTDEDNPLNLTPEAFAALRVAGEKILGFGSTARYEIGTDAKGKQYFTVKGEQELPLIRIYPEDAGGYRYRENVKAVLRPSDPRHIVNTIGFKCEIEGQVSPNFSWRKKSEIMNPEVHNGGFAFGHHREIVTHITSQTSVERDRMKRERDFIKGILAHPYESYLHFKSRFDNPDFSSSPPEFAQYMELLDLEHRRRLVPIPELFPAIDRMLQDMFSDKINAQCKDMPILIMIRDNAVRALRQATLKNRIFCPYVPTVLAISEAIAFFDVIARIDKNYHTQLPSDRMIEHDPRMIEHAFYHNYRYKYRFEQLMAITPSELLIHTYYPLSATDLLKVRCVPIRPIGLSNDFLYVDEFDQSPQEFSNGHDGNHNWRMAMNDRLTAKEYGITLEELYKRSSEFSSEYLEKIRIDREHDTKDQIELKKLKKIILFEIVHEDARPFLKEIICKYIVQREGGSVPFEVPRIDPDTGYMDIVDTLDTGISTLSYVGSKLRHGFYDQVDAQLPQIVDPEYRTARWIAQAAYEMLVELGFKPESSPDLTAEGYIDNHGHVAFEWLLKRACAVGPNNIHNAEARDPDMEKYGDGTQYVNPKRYQANEDLHRKHN